MRFMISRFIKTSYAYGSDISSRVALLPYLAKQDQLRLLINTANPGRRKCLDQGTQYARDSNRMPRDVTTLVLMDH